MRRGCGKILMVTGDRRVFEFGLECVIGNRTHGCLQAEEHAWDEKSEDWIPGTAVKKESQAQPELSLSRLTSPPSLLPSHYHLLVPGAWQVVSFVC